MITTEIINDISKLIEPLIIKLPKPLYQFLMIRRNNRLENFGEDIESPLWAFYLSLAIRNNGWTVKGWDIFESHPPPLGFGINTNDAINLVYFKGFVDGIESVSQPCYWTILDENVNVFRSELMKIYEKSQEINKET